MKKKICVFTGTRAEYWLLKPLIDKLKKNDNIFELYLVISGMHLSKEFGYTYRDIDKNGIKIETVEMLLSSDSEVGITKSVGVGIIGYADVLNRIKPDLVVLLGDRFETFAFASASFLMRISIAHLHGGELTFGAIDESLRHAITKLSMFHFTSTEEYRKNVIQMGEEPDRVFNVGAIGLDNIKKMKLLSKDELEKSLNFKLGKYNFLFTFHPETIYKEKTEESFRIILNSLRKILNEVKDLKIIFTKANADHEGSIINRMLEDFVREFKNQTILFDSLGSLRYLSLVSYVNAVVGNSSSGIIEVPSFKKPTINIGRRQEGRIKAESVIDVNINENELYESYKKVLFDKDFKEKLKFIKNPYGDGNTSEKIIEILKGLDFTFRKKEFFKIDFNL